LKGWLFALNQQMDWLIDRVRDCEYDGLSLRGTERFTPIERAVLALEDRRFYRHSGIDWFFVPRLLRQLLTLKRPGGVSTIEQQLVRTFLERRERTVSRKSREMTLAWILAHRTSKKDIILAYLSNAYLGYRIRGVDEASHAIFGISAEELSLEQSTLIAAMLVYPLPKAVRHALADSVCSLPEDFLTLAASANSKWTKRVRRRMRYGLSVATKIKQPR
jgi:hypothetical protein